MESREIYLSPKIILNEFQREYISLIPPKMDLMEALDYSLDLIKNSIKSISEQDSLFKYLPEKWSIRTMIMHLSDAERIFQYRALAIARNETQELPGFEENVYADESRADLISFE